MTCCNCEPCQKFVDCNGGKGSGLDVINVFLKVCCNHLENLVKAMQN